MRLQILTQASIKMTALWDVVLCSLVEERRRFRSTYSPDNRGSRGEWGITAQVGKTAHLFWHSLIAVAAV
jgi:hypothetical protein